MQVTLSEPAVLSSASKFQSEPVEGRKVSKVIKTTVVHGERTEKHLGDASLASDLPSAKEDFEEVKRTFIHYYPRGNVCSPERFCWRPSRPSQQVLRGVVILSHVTKSCMNQEWVVKADIAELAEKLDKTKGEHCVVCVQEGGML